MNIDEVQEALNNPDKLVLYKTEDGTNFMLHQGGGGRSLGGAFSLVDSWELNEDKLPRIKIFDV